MSQQQLNFFEPIENQVRPPNGNSKLVEYGIQNDASDFRVHVGYKAQHIYVFPTQAGREAIEREKNRLELKQGGQQGVNGKTFAGYAVPISSIDDLQSILVPIDLYQKYPIYQEMTTSLKGASAVSIVAEMLKRQLIKLPVNVSLIDDKDMQIRGTDILIQSKLCLQVKCDFLAGERQFGGTGNLFLQTAECNPRRMT